MVDALNWLPDVAALALLTVAVHYVLGLYGLLGLLLLFVLLEHGPSLTDQRQGTKTMDKRTLSALSDNASTEGDDEHELPRQDLYDNDTPAQEEEEDEEDAPYRCLTNHLVIQDVGSINVPPRRRADFGMNPHVPVAFETALFSGHALFLVRTDPEDPRYAALFAGKRRMFWIQVQGRFKKIPQGPVYLGGELPARIAPGLFTRSVALVIMGLIRRLVGHVIFSFGSSMEDSKEADELPTVAFPLYQSVDQFVETREGETLPTLGTGDFGESDEKRSERRHTPLGAERYQVGPTYTFDFHTMYVDLTRWKTVNLPGRLNAMDLARFFDSLPLRLVAYEVHSEVNEVSNSHCQRDKEYLFSFEVRYDKHRRHVGNHFAVTTTVEEAVREGVGHIQNSGRERMSTMPGIGLSVADSEMSTISTTLSDVSTMTEEDPVLAQEHAEFLRLENARRLGQLSFSYLCWMEEVDVVSDVRRVHYVFAVKDKVGEYNGDAVDGDNELAKPVSSYRLAIVSSYEVRNLLQGRHRFKCGKAAEELAKLRFHSRSRIGSYSTILTEAQQAVTHLQRLASEPLPPSVLPLYSSPSDTDTLDGEHLGDDQMTLDEVHQVAAQAALYKCLMKRQRLQEAYTSRTKLSPSRIGVNLSRDDRENMGVVFEGVVYRYYAVELLRQEVLLLTKDALMFYRSYASSAEKQVLTSHIIGARAVEVPSTAAYLDGCSGTDGAFALQISTFAEEIVLCVGTSSTRDAWVRGILQYCHSASNYDHALKGELYIGFAVATALRPANRVDLNSRLLFPQLKLQKPQRDEISDLANIETVVADTVSGALKLVKRTLKRALYILHHAQQFSVTEVLAFLDDASALRAVNLQQLQDSGSHEEQIAFYLNLYHTVLAHAMIAQGFPRSKGQWEHFFTRTCYALSCGSEGGQVSLSLAEIEHVILRARLPRANLPHVSVSGVLAVANGPASRLQNLGIVHPDFRLSLALVTNHSGSEEVVIYDPAYVHDQLNAVVRSLLMRSSAQGHLEMKDSNTIVLPRLFEWYCRDFGGTAGDTSAVNCVRKLLGFMENKLQRQVIDAMGLDDAPLRTTFRSFKYTPKITLEEVTSWKSSVHGKLDASSADPVQTKRSAGMTHL